MYKGVFQKFMGNVYHKKKTYFSHLNNLLFFFFVFVFNRCFVKARVTEIKSQRQGLV